MPFKEGTFSFKEEFTIAVDSEGTVMITPEHPVSVRIAELFNADNWTEKTTATEEEDS